MDLGAMICTPKDPQCLKCPLCDLCKAWASGKPERFPSKTIKRKIPQIEAVSAVIQKGGKVLLRQRPPKGLLGGLWEFPNCKMKEKERLESKLRKHIKREIGMNVEVKESIGMFHQTYSHFKLTLHVFQCQYLGGKITGRWVPFQKLQSLPLSRIHRRIAETISDF